eukprot:6460662-Pyramimonas_sp.AAC.1
MRGGGEFVRGGGEFMRGGGEFMRGGGSRPYDENAVPSSTRRTSKFASGRAVRISQQPLQL